MLKSADTSSRAPSAAPAAARANADARQARLRAQSQDRRERVLAAARSAFFERGLDGTSLREIARRAGYTPGAIYSYFDSKEAMYGALLGESLERLNRCVRAGAPALAGRNRPAAPAQAALRAAARAFFAFYRDHPGDLELGFYLFQGLQPRGLTRELDAQLNGRLRDALAPIERALVTLGLSSDEALTEVTALFAHMVGLLLLGHTGRIRMFGRDAQALFENYLSALLRRADRPSKARGMRR